jgi:toxin YoeB
VKVTFTEEGWQDYCSWSGDRKTLQRINRMIDETQRDPGGGIGKPERLVANLSGYWSRRIDQEHRLVYTVKGDEFIVIQARYHY